MSDAARVPTADAPNLATFTIKVDGAALPETVELLAAHTQYHCNKIPYAVLQFRDGDPADQTFETSALEELNPGNTLELDLGYQRNETTVFSGIIHSCQIKMAENQPPRFVVECRHKAFAMTLNPACKQFVEVTDSDILSELLSDSDVAGEIDSTNATYPSQMQFRASAWDFALDRAAASGLLLLPKLETIDAKAPSLDGSEALSLAFGSSLDEFEARIDARSQLAVYSEKAWSFANQENEETEAAPGSEIGAGETSGEDLAATIGVPDQEHPFNGNRSIEELQARADARVQLSRVAKIIGRARCQGIADVNPGDLVSFEGVGPRFNGLAWIAGVSHELHRGMWHTHLQIGLDANTSPQRASEHSTPTDTSVRTSGLHVGIVEQLQEDPDGEERILVKLPVTHPEGDGVWARLATLDAGDGRGFVFRPEIGDEVVLGFYEQDSGYPVILGSLHSSSYPSHLEPSDDNHEKAYVSRSGMTLHFNDDINELTLKTASGNTAVLSEDAGGILIEDENGNKIVMDSGGITIESIADINMTASGDVNISGTNINASAQSALKAEGSASAEISASGNTTVKGAVVMIN